MSGTETMTDESGWTKAHIQKLLTAMKTSIPKQDRKRTYSKGLKTFDWKVVAFPPFSPEACQEKWGRIMQKLLKIRTLMELIIEAEDVLSNPVQNLWLQGAKFHKKYPNMSQRKLPRHISKKYLALPDEEKAQHVEEFKLAKERTKKFNKQYKRRRISSDCTDDEQQTEAVKDLPAKPPFNGYNIFCREQRTSVKGFPVNAYMSVVAERWRNLPEEQKEKYSVLCREMKREYLVKLKEYLMTFDEGEQQKILKENGIKIPKEKLLRKVRGVRKVAKKLPGEPTKPSRSGNVIFCKKQMLLLKEKIPNSRERFSKVNQMWQNLSSEEKGQFKEDICEKMKNYSIKLQEWFKRLSKAEQEAYWLSNPTQWQYFDGKQMDVNSEEEPCRDVYRPSDSEDEDLEDSSSDEENEDSHCYEAEEEEEEEEEDHAISFEMY